MIPWPPVLPHAFCCSQKTHFWTWVTLYKLSMASSSPAGVFFFSQQRPYWKYIYIYIYIYISYWSSLLGGKLRFLPSTRRETQRLGGNGDFRLTFRRKRVQTITGYYGRGPPSGCRSHLRLDAYLVSAYRARSVPPRFPSLRQIHQIHLVSALASA